MRTSRCPNSRTRNALDRWRTVATLPRRVRPLIPPPMLRPLFARRLSIGSRRPAAACQSGSDDLSRPARRQAIADTLTRMVRSAYDLKAPNPVARFMSLLPHSGRVISASGGRMTTNATPSNPESSRSGSSSARTCRIRRGSGETTGRCPVRQCRGGHHDVSNSPSHACRRTPTVAGAWTAVFARRAGNGSSSRSTCRRFRQDGDGRDTADAPAAATHQH